MTATEYIAVLLVVVIIVSMWIYHQKVIEPREDAALSLRIMEFLYERGNWHTGREVAIGLIDLKALNPAPSDRQVERCILALLTRQFVRRRLVERAGLESWYYSPSARGVAWLMQERQNSARGVAWLMQERQKRHDREHGEG